MPPKKDEKKPAGWNLTATEFVIVLIFALAIFSYIIPAAWNHLTSGEITFYGFRLTGFVNFIKNTIPFLKFLGFAAAGAAAVATWIFNKRTDEVWQTEKSKIYPENMVEPLTDEIPKNPLVEKWKEIVQKSESANASDWRIAVIEADIILDDLLNSLHLPGETIGDKLKAVEPSDFNTIDAAWEAHKARNMIAHEGENFVINQREIRRIISLYESVFKEFCLI